MYALFFVPSLTGVFVMGAVELASLFTPNSNL